MMDGLLGLFTGHREASAEKRHDPEGFLESRNCCDGRPESEVLYQT